MGKAHRYKPKNIHRKQITAKDTKAKAREEEPLKQLHVFMVISFNYKKMIPYDCGNTNGKIKTEVYLQILRQLLPDMDGITLCQDKDSAYNSAAVKAWAEEEGLNLLTLPGKSPDFSIMESLAHPIKRKFHSKRTVSEAAALAQFTKVWEKEMDQKKIQEMYNCASF
ncbi:hypothetical protein LAWI1_G002132 [Lachnellula willkommii]|uniref:Tc1-like transposase DDE domain-containing protein n=1 Tax=Lachnellula willkommii TaxID=215461 RepID=A0A559MER6_9HELO|nr:hypothetical protein LAWI1_G002132 [Lachnellula willkommii]